MACFLALHASLALGGAGLHALPGFGHDPASLASDHRPDQPDQPAQHDRAADDCPFCHFHAQGQLVADPCTVRIADVLWVRPPAVAPLVLPPDVDRPSSPRAPPFA